MMRCPLVPLMLYVLLAPAAVLVGSAVNHLCTVFQSSDLASLDLGGCVQSQLSLVY